MISVIRRAFRNKGVMMLPGSIVEPGNIKRYKSRVRYGQIVIINEQDYAHWQDFFKVRYGVKLGPIASPPKEPKVTTPVEADKAPTQTVVSPPRTVVPTQAIAPAAPAAPAVVHVSAAKPAQVTKSVAAVHAVAVPVETSHIKE